MLDVKGFFKTEWGRKFDETVRRLNSAPNFQMLEVGWQLQNQILC